MRRRARRLVLMLLLGLATTVVVALAHSALGGWVRRGGPVRQGYFTDGIAVYQAFIFRPRGVEVAAWSREPPGKLPPPPAIVPRSAGLLEAQPFRDGFPRWTGWTVPALRDAVIARPDGLPAVAIRAGWPWPALLGRMSPDDLAAARPSGVFVSGTLLRIREGSGVYSYGWSRSLGGVIFPLTPAWPGLLANTALYAALWWLGFATLASLRAARRRRRGLCTSCGYAMHATPPGSPCPECGTPGGPSRGALAGAHA